MTPESWKQVKEVLHQALEREPGQRAEFLSKVCASDEELRHEVEELLSAHGNAPDGFLVPSLPSVAPGMLLATGTRLGVYQIVEPLGVGGMGEVYRAQDSRLQRAVALKILPMPFAGDPDRLARFEREARALAALNHPNIATLHGMEEAGGWHFLIMELVEGKSLRGPLPLEEALRIARQIVEALEAAHESGITHRDLKPGNIMVKPDGTVKVLDFGLAKVSSSRHTSRKDSLDLSGNGTLQGLILGTAAYMAPEQARGMPVDKRADIWAFGVLLYEMLTGKPMFKGETVTDILAAVVRGEPDWSALPATTPPSIRRLLTRCVEKDVKKRLPDIGVARLEIDEVSGASVTMTVADAPAAEVTRRNIVPWLTTVVALLALAVVSWYALRTQPEVRWTGMQLSESAAVAMTPRVSPDGELLAFLSLVDGLTQVAVMKPETGNWTLLTHDRSRGWVTNIAWSRDGAKLYFSRFEGSRRGIFSVPVLGGEERLVVENAGYPQVLPDGSLLFQRQNEERRFQLFRFWQDSGRIQALKAWPKFVFNSPTFRVTPDGERILFLGKAADDPAEDRLYVMDLKSEKATRLAPGEAFVAEDFFPLASTDDGRSALVDLPSGNLHRIVSVPLNGDRTLRTILTLTTQVACLDAGRDGSLYLDQLDQPVEIVRVSAEGGPPIHIGTMSSYDEDAPEVLPLPDGRLLMNSRIGGRQHLLLKTSGRDPSLFVETQEETAAPTAVVGQTQVGFMIGTGNNRTIALASLADGRITRRLQGTRGVDVTSMVASPDGQTIYYSDADSIWSIAVSDGQPQRLRDGTSVTLDPRRHELIVRVPDKEGNLRLVRAPTDGGMDRPLTLQNDVRLSLDRFSSNAVNKSGRLLAQLAVPNSWFWPAAVIDPDTGRVHVIHLGYDANVRGGWSDDGQLVLAAIRVRASLWRFRPER